MHKCNDFTTRFFVCYPLCPQTLIYYSSYPRLNCWGIWASKGEGRSWGLPKLWLIFLLSVMYSQFWAHSCYYKSKVCDKKTKSLLVPVMQIWENSTTTHAHIHCSASGSATQREEKAKCEIMKPHFGFWDFIRHCPTICKVIITRRTRNHF